jgi:hypothetical protein
MYVNMHVNYSLFTYSLRLKFVEKCDKMKISLILIAFIFLSSVWLLTSCHKKELIDEIQNFILQSESDYVIVKTHFRTIASDCSDGFGLCSLVLSSDFNTDIPFEIALNLRDSSINEEVFILEATLLNNVPHLNDLLIVEEYQNISLDICKRLGFSYLTILKGEYKLINTNDFLKIYFLVRKGTNIVEE